MQRDRTSLSVSGDVAVARKGPGCFFAGEARVCADPPSRSFGRAVGTGAPTPCAAPIIVDTKPIVEQRTRVPPVGLPHVRRGAAAGPHSRTPRKSIGSPRAGRAHHRLTLIADGADNRRPARVRSPPRGRFSLAVNRGACRFHDWRRHGESVPGRRTNGGSIHRCVTDRRLARPRAPDHRCPAYGCRNGTLRPSHRCPEPCFGGWSSGRGSRWSRRPSWHRKDGASTLRDVPAVIRRLRKAMFWSNWDPSPAGNRLSPASSPRLVLVLAVYRVGAACPAEAERAPASRSRDHRYVVEPLSGRSGTGRRIRASPDLGPPAMHGNRAARTRDGGSTHRSVAWSGMTEACHAMATVQRRCATLGLPVADRIAFIAARNVLHRAPLSLLSLGHFEPGRAPGRNARRGGIAIGAVAVADPGAAILVGLDLTASARRRASSRPIEQPVWTGGT